MSNNKQSMKLYTKKDFLKAAEFCEVSMSDAKYIILRIDEVTDPIELPSDEEIGKLRDEHIPIDEENMWSERFYFTIGAKAMRDKIQGGNNEQ